MPIKDNDLVAQYIRAIENPDSIGYKDGKWYQPSNSKYDKNNRGFGIDVVHNKAARGIVSNRQGKWLTEEEERELRNKHIIESQKVLDKRVPWHSLRETPSEEKNAMAIGMLYRGDSVLGNQVLMKICKGLYQNIIKLKRFQRDPLITISFLIVENLRERWS